MKKIIMIAAAALMTMGASAQVYVGGSLSFSSNKPAHLENTDVDTKTSFSIIPEIGYNLDENWAVGIGLGYSHSKEGDFKKDNFSIEPYARYTFAKIGKVDLFAEGVVGYAHSKNTIELSQNTYRDDKSDTFYFGVRPGLKFNVNEKLSLISRIGWVGWTTNKPDTDNYKGSSDFEISLDASKISFGVNYTF